MEFYLDFTHVQQLLFGQIIQPTMKRQILTELKGNDNTKYQLDQSLVVFIFVFFLYKMKIKCLIF